MRVRWLLAGGWVVVAGATKGGFVLDGVSDPQAQPFIVALVAMVATLLVASVICLPKGRTSVGRWRLASISRVAGTVS